MSGRRHKSNKQKQKAEYEASHQGERPRYCYDPNASKGQRVTRLHSTATQKPEPRLIRVLFDGGFRYSSPRGQQAYGSFEVKLENESHIERVRHGLCFSAFEAECQTCIKALQFIKELTGRDPRDYRIQLWGDNEPLMRGIAKKSPCKGRLIKVYVPKIKAILREFAHYTSEYVPRTKCVAILGH